MPDFLNPFSGVVPRPMTKGELIRAIRLNLAAEEEAVHLYVAHADATDDPLAKKVLLDIADEERVHAGEFLELLRRLAPDEAQFLENGRKEVEEMAESAGGAAPAAAPEAPGTTIGSLRQAAGEEA
jgi:rubrerythrin